MLIFEQLCSNSCLIIVIVDNIIVQFYSEFSFFIKQNLLYNMLHLLYIRLFTITYICNY